MLSVLWIRFWGRRKMGYFGPVPDLVLWNAPGRPSSGGTGHKLGPLSRLPLWGSFSTIRPSGHPTGTSIEPQIVWAAFLVFWLALLPKGC